MFRESRAMMVGSVIAGVSSAATRTVFVPCWRVRVRTSATAFSGAWGAERKAYYYDWSTKRFRYSLVTDWTPVKGTLPGSGYWLTVYAGTELFQKSVDEAFGESLKNGIPERLVTPFKRSHVPHGVTVEAFSLKSARAEQLAHERAEEKARLLIVETVRKNYKIPEDCSVRVDSLSIDVAHFDMQAAYLPGYVRASRVLAAVDEASAVVSGSEHAEQVQRGVKSIGVFGVLGYIAQMIIPLFIPALRGVRGLWLLGGASGYYWNRRREEKTKQEAQSAREDANARVWETEGDRWRVEYHELMEGALYEAGLEEETAERGRILGGRVPEEELLRLGFTSGQRITKNLVRKNFCEKLQTAHPDRVGGSAAVTMQLLEARERIMEALHL